MLGGFSSPNPSSGPSPRQLDQPELHLAVLGDHGLGPGRIPDDIDAGLVDAGGRLVFIK